MDTLSTTIIYNSQNSYEQDYVVRFIPTGFTNGDTRLFYVIKESPYDSLEPGSVVNADVLSVEDIELAFDIKLPITSKPISRTIKTTPNDKDLGATLRGRQIELENNNPTLKFDDYVQ